MHQAVIGRIDHLQSRLRTDGFRPGRSVLRSAGARRDHLETPGNLLGRALGISAHTLSRRRDADTLTTDESDRPALLAKIVTLAWKALDGAESPFDCMDTAVAMPEIKIMLYHIEYAIPA